MKGLFQKEQKVREAKRVKRAPKKAPPPESIAERYFEVLRLRQRLLEADASRANRQ
ncbi:hypothetical protein G8O24_13365 [Bradyrhizobium sp. INPA01-394B]|uniref:DUF3175 domain-containing protein n=1 Tax=Bradyrhizobium campsiandrae TaxID=1729892 RepID=A0ABR7UEU0_9BRAD|nr:hypothetical protein [Bradyrhizobium campsiandrae]MBC9878331.1 hypothetical protein [Bradyrhizobium campsiandrae]MBC9982413.1 hypothetical protein [Bradyrhizobium campsiandrae]